MIEDNINRPESGLHTDKSLVDQPKGTTRFVLNGINETDEGDTNFIANENSNEQCFQLPEGYVPLGQVYIGNNETVIFSVARDESASEIGIANVNCEYATHVNDLEAPAEQKLNFRLAHQIDATYRLRRGCERTVYFVDGDNNRPRYYNFDGPEQFQTGGNWDSAKFELVRSYRSVPSFQDIEVLNTGGILEPGSYNIAVQYLDENLNPTEWIFASPLINIYNDDTTNDFLNIEGSINIETGADEEDYRNFPTTDKAISVVLDDLDESFLYYRLAFIEATTGNGLVNRVRYTENIPISKNYFIYTGRNFATEGTEEEIQAFDNIISSAGSIEQIENRLILGNVTGNQANFCNLQKYASRIKTDMITKEILSNVVSPANPKSPTVHFEGVGYMPGEIYSFGIVYVFKDGSLSPVYHIPGKSPEVDSLITFTPGTNVYPMSNNNQSLNNVYIDNTSCENGDYWGFDSEGNPLKNQPVRHHRFPLRSDLNLPLVEQVETLEGESDYNQITFTATGTITLPCTQEQIDAGECTTLQEAPPFQARLTYSVDGVEDFVVLNIDPSAESNPFEVTGLSDFIVSDNIVLLKIEEDVAGVEEDVTGPFVGDDLTGGPSTSPLNSLTYTASIGTAVFTSEERLFKNNIFGVQFSGVTIPTLEDTNGEEIIGYYIVRNERVEDEKTILDSAAIVPTFVNKKYISHGLVPELGTTANLSKRVFSMIHPEHRFRKQKYGELTSIIQQGTFDIVDRKKSKIRRLDVQDGTSFDSSVHKSGGGADNDGWSLKAITRDNITEFKQQYGNFNYTSDDLENLFYLAALESRNINDEANSVYNLAGDNQVGFLQFKEDIDTNFLNTIPYVYLKRDIADSYSTFRSLPYYKDSVNLEDTETVSIFGGDTYTVPYRNVNTMFWDNRLARRAGRTSVWNYIIGAIIIVVGVVLAFFTGGSSLLLVGAGIALIGGGALFISSGIKRDNLVRAYYEEYAKGLRETVLDDWVLYEYNGLPCQGYGSPLFVCDTPEDDEIQWIGDCITDLWFETQINISIRNGMTADVPTHLNAPGRIESGNDFIEPAYEHFGIYKQRDNVILPFTELDKHIHNKLLYFDTERDDSRGYIGHPLGEYNEINPDYLRIVNQKTYFHLPLEYDCCSDCNEIFPHRVHYSEQSFQEELSDNYRIFLPNNYRDIEGEKGSITNMFRLKNNLYIHTEEAFWHLPQVIQERITGDVVSFIGTGDFFSIPPRKIVDSDKTSAGTRHKWGTMKTKNGVIFPFETERKWYHFDGNSLTAISDAGNEKWFRKNMLIKADFDYLESSGNPYPYSDNPSNPYGTGFLSVYDTKKERYIVSKKDFQLSDQIIGNDDYEICLSGGELILFDNYQQTIADQEALGWQYVGLEDCRMKFTQTTFEPTTEIREITTVTTISPDTIVVPFFDTTSLGSGTIANLSATLDAWFPDFKNSINGGVNNITFQNPGTWNHWGTERWVIDPPSIALTQLGAGKDVLLLIFVDESNSVYHGGSISNPMTGPTASYINDVNTFVNTIHPAYGSFLAINYPIVRSGRETAEYLQHAIAAIEGVDMTLDQVNALNQNPFFSVGEWDIVKANLQNNPYVGQPILRDFGWLYKEDRINQIDGNTTAECPTSSGEIIPPCVFTNDVEELLEDVTIVETELIEVEIFIPTTRYLYIDGVVVEEPLGNNHSWTMSYSLRNKHWVSWHSYLPDFFYYIMEDYYGWKEGSDYMWRFNRPNHYQTFFGVYYPHIVEYVSLSNPIATRIWEDVQLQTEAKSWNDTYEEFSDERFITFNKLIAYNSRQSSGLLNLVVKDTQNPADYLLQQVESNDPTSITIDRNERDWNINDLRDIRTDYTIPLFRKDSDSLQAEYFIDKIINNDSINYNKDWTQLESFRDKFLVLRLIFDNFDNIRLITNYSKESENKSFR